MAFGEMVAQSLLVGLCGGMVVTLVACMVASKIQKERARRKAHKERLKRMANR